MPPTGFVRAGSVPGEQVASKTFTEISDPITTVETVVMAVAAPVVTGRVYKVEADFGTTMSVTTDTFFARITEDSLAGNVIQLRRVSNLSTGTVHSVRLYAEYTANDNESKTFVVTLQRSAGSGSIKLASSSVSPAYLRVTYLSG